MARILAFMDRSTASSPVQSSSNLPPSPPNSDATHASAQATNRLDANGRSSSPDGEDPPASPLDSTTDTRRRKKKKKQGAANRGAPRFPLNLRLMLDNSGSVARDHLASERTFLAYVRTSVAIASTGVALVQLFTIAETSNQALEKYSRPLGATFIMIGLLTLALGGVRYFMVQNALIRGVYPAIRISVVLISLTLGAIILIVFCIIIVVEK